MVHFRDKTGGAVKDGAVQTPGMRKKLIELRRVSCFQEGGLEMVLRQSCAVRVSTNPLWALNVGVKDL